MKKKRFKRFLTVMVTLLSVICTTLLGLGISHLVHISTDKSMIGKTQTGFAMDDMGNRISNIPYDDYLTGMDQPSGSVIPDELHENNRAEDNTDAIQKTINLLSDTDGGVVYIPKGTYKISTVELKSNVTLFVSEYAVLVSLNYEENEASDHPIKNAVIFGENAKNIAVVGGGTIDGCGESYTNEAKNPEPFYALENFNLYTRVIESRKRVRMEKTSNRNNVIQFYQCSNVKIENIRMKDAAAWTCVLSDSQYITIENVVIDNNMHVANTDGIDIVGSSNVTIKHCFIATGDDAIVLKPIDNEIRNVEISNCIISSFANCFKIGTETLFSVMNVSVKDCYFFLPDGITGGYAGIAIESADGSQISDITVSNIEMDGISSPLLIWLGNRFKFDNKSVGSIDSISIMNIKATNAELPSAITGCQNDGNTYYVTNVKLSDFNVTYRNTKESISIKKNVGMSAMSGYPEITRVSHIYFLSHETSRYWDLPCYGFFIRNVTDITTENIFVVPRDVNTREFAYLTETDANVSNLYDGNE